MNIKINMTINIEMTANITMNINMTINMNIVHSHNIINKDNLRKYYLLFQSQQYRIKMKIKIIIEILFNKIFHRDGIETVQYLGEEYSLFLNSSDPYEEHS